MIKATACSALLVLGCADTKISLDASSSSKSAKKFLLISLAYRLSNVVGCKAVCVVVCIRSLHSLHSFLSE